MGEIKVKSCTIFINEIKKVIDQSSDPNHQLSIIDDNQLFNTHKDGNPSQKSDEKFYNLHPHCINSSCTGVYNRGDNSSCYTMLIPKELLNYYSRDGAVVISSGWFNPKSSVDEKSRFNHLKERLKNSDKLIVLDTAIFENLKDNVTLFTTDLGISFEIIPVGLSGIRNHFIPFSNEIRKYNYLSADRSINSVEDEFEQSKSSKKYRRVFNHSKSLIMEVDASNYKIISCNPRMAARFNSTPDQLEGVDCRKLLPPEQFKIRELFSYKALKENRTIDFETEHNNNFYKTSASPITVNGKKSVLIVSHNITSLKEAELENLQLKVGVEQSSNSIVVTNTNTEILYTNRAFENLTGYSREEILGKKPRLLKSGYHSKQFYREMWKKLKGGESWYGEFYNKRKDGSLFWEKATISPVKDREGKIVSYIAIKEDITEQKMVLTQLKESKEKFQAVFENAYDGILIIDANTRRFILGNDRLVDMLDLSHSELKQLTLTDIHPERIREKIIETFNAQVSGKIKLSKNTPVLKKDGTRFYANINASPFSIGDKKYLVAIFRDTTKDLKRSKLLRESEKRFRNIVEATKSLITTVDIEGNLTYVNFMSNRVYGLEPDKAKGLNAFSFIHPDDQEETRLMFGKWLESDDDDFTFINRQISVTGDIHTIRWNIHKNFSSDNEITSFSSIGVDITKLMEQERGLQEAISTKDRFISILGHDLKNPFTTLLGFTELLVENFDKYDEEKIKHFLNSIKNITNNTYNLLNNLLEWSRTQRDNTPFDPKDLNINSLIDETIALSQFTASVKGIKIIFNPLQNTNIIADQEMIKTVVRNILFNSIKFTPKGGEIEIKSYKSETTSTIEIIDNGIGMGKEVVDSLFRVEKTRSTRGTEGERGTGFGLLLCDQFIRKHNGYINVKSEKGIGTTFYINLPL